MKGRFGLSASVGGDLPFSSSPHFTERRIGVWGGKETCVVRKLNFTFRVQALVALRMRHSCGHSVRRRDSTRRWRFGVGLMKLCLPQCNTRCLSVGVANEARGFRERGYTEAR
jgi:hypothetical protein